MTGSPAGSGQIQVINGEVLENKRFGFKFQNEQKLNLLSEVNIKML
jgi:hypothetical protein